MFETKYLRGISRLLIVTVTAMALQPLTAAAQMKNAAPQAAPANVASATNAVTAGDRYARNLADMEETLKGAEPQAFYKGKGAADAAGLKVRIQALRNQHQQLQQDEAAAEAEFAAVGQQLKDKNLPEVIQARHQAAMAEFHARKAQFNALIQKIESDDDSGQDVQASLSALADFMARHPNSKPYQFTDPNNLPWRTPTPIKRQPYTSPTQFKLSSLFGEPIRLAQAGSISGLTLPNTTPPATPTADDLAATDEIQITPAIQALAASLNKNPVQIYNWVRNNIEYLPSYGSIQGSDLTLQSKRGNAFDTASLLIALYRASGIPARYVYGTIEVPATQAMNWVGGVNTPEAALEVFGRGYVPNIGVVAGGAVQSLRIEHVWVSAYVDYVPSRGAINKTPNTWVPLDVSYKQYTYAPGMNIQGNVSFDPNAFLTQAQAGATINTTAGYVQNLNQANIQTALANYQNQVQAYVTAQNANATVGDVLGTKTIVAKNPSILMGTLPYKTVAIGATLPTLPDNLKWKYRTAVGDGTLDPYGNPDPAHAIQISQSTAALAGKKLTLSFTPASQADIDTLNSYLPKPHADGTPIQPSELPSSLPAYLIQVLPELRVEGQLVAQGTSPVLLGGELSQTTALFNPATQAWEPGESQWPIGGEYHAIALDLQGIAGGSLQAVQTRLAATQAKLQQFQANPGDTTPIQGLSKEDLTGDLLYAGVLGYFASVDSAGQLAARANGQVVAYRMPSYGDFGIDAKRTFYFGLARTVSFPGVMMDIRRMMEQVVAKDAESNKRVTFVRQIGAMESGFEHAVPERLFADPGKPLNDPSQPQGISAVKALQIAASQGQRIYTITQANAATALPQISQSAAVMTDIQNAIAAGKEVTVHEAPITAYGWSGCGYVITDPDTGTGAYRISGGANGAVLLCFIGALMTILGLYFLPIAAGILLAVYGAQILFIGTLIAMLTGWFNFDIFTATRVLGLALGTMLIPFEAAPAALLALVLTVTIWLSMKALVSSIRSESFTRYAAASDRYGSSKMVAA